MTVIDWCLQYRKAPIKSSRPNIDDKVISWKIYLKFLIQVLNFYWDVSKLR